MVSMSVEIIYSHIPKTGGVSFRKALLEHYEPNEILHPWFWFGTRPEYQKAIEMWSDYDNLKRKWNKKAENIHPNVKVIMGHFPMRLFDGLFPEAFRMIFLRNPIDRVISAYYHYKRNEFLVGDHTKPFKPRSPNMTLKQFADLPRQQDVQHHFIKSAHEFDFIGITEHYKQSLDRLWDALGWDDKPTVAHYNKGFYAEVDQDTREYIGKRNIEDFILWKLYKDVYHGKRKTS